MSLRTPYVQQRVTNYATSYISDKTQTQVNIDRLFITFLGAAQIEGLYLEDLQKDTLLYARSITIDLAWPPLLNGFVKVKSADLSGIVGNLYNHEKDSSYNYQFLINAFTSQDSTANQSTKSNTQVNAQSDSSSIPFSIDEINLNNIRFSYADVFTEMKTLVALQSLHTTIDSIDFNTLLFDVNEFHLDGLNFSFHQAKASSENSDTTKSSLPIIKLNQFALSNVKLQYDALYDSLFLQSAIRNMGIEKALVNLNKQQVTSDDFMLDAALFSLKMAETDTTNVPQNKENSDTAFSWPAWDISINKFEFNLTKLAVDQGTPPEKVTHSFDPSHLHFKDLHLESNNLKFAPENVHAEGLQATLASKNNDFKLNKLYANLNLNSGELSINKLIINTANSYLESNQEFTFPSVSSLFSGDLEAINAKITIQTGTSLDLKEAYYFAPSLQEISLYDSIAQEKIKLYGQLYGNANSTSFQNLSVLYGKNSSLQANGVIKNWLSTEKLEAHLRTFKINANLNDFRFILPDSYASSYPQHIQLTGSAHYDPQQVSTKLEGSLDALSKMQLDASYSFMNANEYAVKFTGQSLAIDRWLKDSVNLSPVNIQLNAEGSGINWPDLSTSVKLKIADFKYQNNTFDTLAVALEIKNGLLDLSSEYDDDKLKYSLTADGVLDSSTQKINLQLTLDQLNLHTFHLTDSIAYLKTNLSATALIDSLSQSLDLKISQLSFADQNSYYELAPVNLKVINGADSSAIDFNWEEIALQLKLNQPLGSLTNIQLSQENLMNLNLFKIDTAYGPIDLELDLNASLSNDLNAMLKEQLDFDPIKMHAKYNSNQKNLAVDLKVPKLRYNAIHVDSLELKVNADTSSLQLSNTIKKIESGFINIFATEIDAQVNPEEATFKLNMKDDVGDSLFIIQAEADKRSDSLLWKINTESLILNGEKWSLDEHNYFFIAKDHFQIRYMAFQRKEEKFLIETIDEKALHGLHVNFKDFNVGNLIAILNPEEVILAGILNGDIKMNDLNNPLNFKAEISLADVKILGEPAGKVELATSQIASGKYELSINSEGPMTLNGKGMVDTNPASTNFNIDLNLEQLSLPFITVFTEGLIKEAEGTLSGKFALSGTTDDFSYSGDLRFKNATLFITDLNTSFGLPDEVISLDKKTINLSNFTIVDRQNHKMVLDGKVVTEDLLNPSFNLKLNADNFQLMNKEQKPDELFYGTVFIDATATIRGTLSQPIVKADLKINEDTDFVYVVPTSAVDIVQMEGIVRFKSPYEAIDSLQNTSDSTKQNVDISGIDLNAVVKTDKKAKFKVIVDERRGDYLIVSGESDLNFELGKNGDINLTGNYLVNDGYYQLSLYDLVKRKFEITSGSQVKWYGDPLEAGLNITANYSLETSPNTLMANQNISTRKLPFIVELFINGSLSTPEISFGLSMPQDDRGALGGRVYQQIQAINNNETELNKQVFSLLVLNQFFPTGSTGEGPDSEVLARNSASQILTNQLNKLSSQYIKGVDLNLDLDSYKASENGAAEQRTQLGLSLSKSLFDDRFKVQVGSQFELEGEQRGQQSASEILGNILVEYLLTEDGRYKLTGYRKNEYEGLIDGQVTVTGISVQFNKEFEKFSELLNGTKEEKDAE